MTDTLPKDLAGQIDDLLRRSGEAERDGRLDEAVGLGRDAWELMPPPRENWDFYPQIIATAQVRVAVRKSDLAAARDWIATMRALYGDGDRARVYVGLIEGKALLDLGERDEAVSVLGAIYERDGRRPFKGEYAPCLDVYLKERARRRG